MSSDLESVFMLWNSSKSSKYTVQMWNNKTLSWQTARCIKNTFAGPCVIEVPRARVISLRPSTTYYFRIYVSKAMISAPSKPMKTKRLGRLIALPFTKF